MPSTRHAGIEKPWPRTEKRVSALASSARVDTAYRLFSMKNATGSFHVEARFMDSSTEPIWLDPSPK